MMKSSRRKGRLDGSAVECLSSAQGVILESQDQVPHQAPGMDLAFLSGFLSVSLMNK